MVQVIITKSLRAQIFKKFKEQSIPIFELLVSLEKSPHKGKLLHTIQNIAIKELKYKTYRFYFITNGTIIKFGDADQLSSLIIKFISLSKKNDQQKTIDKIKDLLEKMSFNDIE